MNYVERFEKLGFGLYVHFGLYSIVGKGEWFLHANPEKKAWYYDTLPAKFKVRKDWAKKLVKTAKETGCKYLSITTRHHDGFSLYDTCGLNELDAPHSACGRDLIREFVDECSKSGIVPFFYHTLLDWWQPDYKNNFPAYIDYLIKSVEILCKNYGKIGGILFDGMWDKPDADWQEDRLYSTIRKYQPEAIIINNTGLDELGRVGHPQLDSVTFERGKPAFVDNSDRHRAGEMSQILNDHWGYASDDCNYKPVRELIENLVDCRKYNCNFLLNIGPYGDGSVGEIDRGILKKIGKWVKMNKGFIYGVKSCDITAEGADILQGDDGYYYAVIKDVPMSFDPNVQRSSQNKTVKINAWVTSAKWLDSGEKIEVKKGEFAVKPFYYGTSLSVRVAKFKIRK